MFRIAILGAESTGKTQLALALETRLRERGVSVGVVPEALRDWCQQQGRTPRPEEQFAIAREQARRIDAMRGCAVLLADTSALMVAIYSELLFADRAIRDFALQQQRGFDLTLLTGLDLPWVADGIQRDGAHVRPTVDAMLRGALQQAGIGFATVYGGGEQRAANALRAIDAGMGAPPASGDGPPWRWECDKCSDPDCEHRLFTALLARPGKSVRA